MGLFLLNLSTSCLIAALRGSVRRPRVTFGEYLVFKGCMQSPVSKTPPGVLEQYDLFFIATENDIVNNLGDR